MIYEHVTLPLNHSTNTLEQLLDELVYQTGMSSVMGTTAGGKIHSIVSKKVRLEILRRFRELEENIQIIQMATNLREEATGKLLARLEKFGRSTHATVNVSEE